MKVFESELKVLEVLWDKGPMTAADIARVLKESTEWSRNTAYTVIKRCVDKGLVRRDDPRFMCTALVSLEDVRASETEDLIDRMYQGSRTRFFAAFLDDSDISEAELRELRDLIDRKGRKDHA